MMLRRNITQVLAFKRLNAFGTTRLKMKGSQMFQNLTFITMNSSRASILTRRRDESWNLDVCTPLKASGWPLAQRNYIYIYVCIY